MAKLPKGLGQKSPLRKRICHACGELQDVARHFKRWDSKTCIDCAEAKKKPLDKFRIEENRRIRDTKATLGGPPTPENIKRCHDVHSKAKLKTNAEKEAEQKVWAKPAPPPDPTKVRHQTQVMRARSAKDPVPGKTASEAVVKQELASREMSRRKLIHFILRMFPEYQPGWVHNLICTKLEKFSQDVRDKKAPRLMLFVPPRHGKSEIASKMFPAWHLGHAPNHEIIAASYGVSLPMGFSRKIKEMLKVNLYKNVFPECRLHPDAQAT